MHRLRARGRGGERLPHRRFRLPAPSPLGVVSLELGEARLEGALVDELGLGEVEAGEFFFVVEGWSGVF